MTRARASHALLALLLAAAQCACEDLDSFSTGEGEIYRGEVLGSDFVLCGFAAGTRLEMTFDVSLAMGDETHVGPGTITTVPPAGEDVMFENADLVPVGSIIHDQLSAFDFPTGRLKNYLFFADASGPLAGRQALVIVSLLSDGDVEARIIMGASDLYGIFVLEKTEI